MQIIEITVRDRIATHVGEDYYVCGNSDYVIHFDFDEEWDALDIKTARFIAEGNILYPDQIFSGSECPMPVISDTTNIRIGVFAGNLQTTTPARVPAVKSILCGTSTPAAPQEDAYHQAMEEMSKVATSAKADAASAAQSAVEADASAENAAQAAETAGQHAADAGTQAQAAGASANAAANSANDAAASAEAASKAKQDAIDNADDAEEAAKDAQTWAGRAEVYAGNAATSAEGAVASAVASAQSAQESAQAAQAAQDTAEAMTEDVVGPDGRGGLYIVTCNGMKSNRTQEEIRAAVNASKTVLLRGGVRVYTYYGETDSKDSEEAAAGKTCPTFIIPMVQQDNGLYYDKVQVHEDGSVSIYGGIAKTINPNKLTFSGAVEAEYSGSAAVNVELPESINNLLIVTTAIVDGNRVASHTPTEIRDAAGSDDKIVLLLHGQTVYTLDGTTTVDGALQSEFNGYAYVDEDRRVRVERVTVDADSIVHRHQDVSRMYVPNPYALTLTGAVNATYDGKTAVTVEIPQGGGGTVETAEDAEVLQALADIDMITAVGEDGYVLTDENNNILEW